MALTVTATIVGNLNWNEIDTNKDNTHVSNVGGVNNTKSIANGTDIDEADTQWNTSTTIPTGATLTYDLTSLTKEVFGGSFTMNLSGGVVKAFEVANLSTGVLDSLSIRFDAANGFTTPFGGAAPVITLGGGDVFLLSAGHFGFNVNASNRIIQIQDDGDGAEFSMAVVARTGS